MNEWMNGMEWHEMNEWMNDCGQPKALNQYKPSHIYPKISIFMGGSFLSPQRWVYGIGFTGL